MKERCLVSSILILLIVFIFYANLLAVPNLEKDPNWLVDEEISQICKGWNHGHIKCWPPRGGYNDITENQKILNSWGYKAGPLSEIKDLLPAPQYEMYCKPDQFGTFRINETAYDPVKPRGAL